jgi:polysaccharide biosynthesis protein PslA
MDDLAPFMRAAADDRSAVDAQGGLQRTMTNSYSSLTDLAAADSTREQPRWQRRRQQISAVVFAGIVRACDVVLLLAGSLLAWHLAGRFGWDAPGGDLLAVLLAAWVAIACLRRGDGYRLSRLLSPAAQLRWLAVALLAGVVTLGIARMIVHGGIHPAPFWLADWFVLNGLLLGAGRLAAVQLATRWRAEGRLARRVALVGATETGHLFANRLREHDETDIDILGVYDDAPVPEAIARADLPFLGNIGQLVADGQQGLLDAVVITLPPAEAARVARIGDALGHLVLDVFVAPDLAAAPYHQVGSFGGLPVGLLARRPLSDWQVVQKAVFDRICAALLLVVFAPLLGLLALLVRLDSPGPVLFRQRRTGFNNRPFDCLKFRTMHHHMTDALADRQTTRGDKRITRVGRWLRRLSLDELPQLFNVLHGEMSLVGPRPHAPNTKAANRLFQDVVADYARRHRVKPGITGWAQVNGWRGETATEEEIEQRVLHDLYYIQNWSLLWDLRILLMTATRVYGDPKAF